MPIIIMDLESKKYKIIEKLMKVSDEETLYQIEKIIDSNKTSDLPKPIQRLLSQSIKDSEEGKVSSHEEVMTKIKTKYNL